MISGKCNCGTVAFELSTDPSGVFVCHCSICRAATGSNGIAVVIVDNDQFQWMQGEKQITSWKKPGSDWGTCFCSVCGSPLPGANDDQRMFIPAGLLAADERQALKVIHHIWVGSKADWDEIGDSGKQHHGAFEGR